MSRLGSSKEKGLRVNFLEVFDGLAVYKVYNFRGNVWVARDVGSAAVVGRGGLGVGGRLAFGRGSCYGGFRSSSFSFNSMVVGL